jgi:essential nuclear protein 1
MPRAASKKSNTRHDPLHHVLNKDEEFEKYGRVSQPGRRKKHRQSEENGDNTEVSRSLTLQWPLA